MKLNDLIDKFKILNLEMETILRSHFLAYIKEQVFNQANKTILFDTNTDGQCVYLVSSEEDFDDTYVTTEYLVQSISLDENNNLSFNLVNDDVIEEDAVDCQSAKTLSMAINEMLDM